MTVDVLKSLQTDLKTLGFYAGDIDGKWGAGSHGAFLNARRSVQGLNAIPSGSKMTPNLFNYCKAVAWSAKVSTVFIDRVIWTASALKMTLNGPDELMACMAFETGETFSPTIPNGAGAPYYGLIQFGALAAKDAGTTIAELVKMTAEDQINFVYRYFKPLTGKLLGLNDIYMKILYPIAVGKPDDYVLFIKDDGTKKYIQNKGLDLNLDGKITKAEACAKVQEKLVKGLHPFNLRVS